MLRTAIIGASGFVGRHLLSAFRRIDPETVGTGHTRVGPGLVPFDIRKPDLRAMGLKERSCRSVIIAAAKPNVAFCEQHPEEAYEVNVRGMLELIRQAADLELRVVFLSSDYVYSGATGGYDDDAPTNPTTEYGRQKVHVEKELPRIASDCLVIRLSKIYGLEKGDHTLLDEIASALMGGRKVLAATDQVFCPTLAADLAAAVLEVEDRRLQGVINIAAPEPWSRHEVAVAIADALGQPHDRITAVRLHDLPGMEGRPLNTSLTCARLAAEAKATFRPLRESIAAVAAHWKDI